VNPLLQLLRRVPRLRPDLDRPPAYGAALVQLVATLSAVAQALWLGETLGVAMTALEWAALQGCIACVLATLLNSAWWWRAIHLVFAPALVLGLTLHLPPLACLLILLALLGVYWGSHRNQVPLYLSGEPAWREVEHVLAAHPAKRVIDLGSGLGGLIAFLGRSRPDLRVDGIEAAPLPLLASRIRKWLHNWHGSVMWGDLWRVDLAAYDVAHAYLSPVPMQMLWQKACCEMRPGSLLLSHSFAVPGVAPLMVRQLSGNVRIYVYRVGH
jgi:hypothetical protein